MRPWDKYVASLKQHPELSGLQMKQAVERFEQFKARPDVYFDEAPVLKCIEFFGKLKHFLGKSAGKPFILEPWQTFILACILGLKWKDTGLRVCRETYIQIARKAGKDAFMAGLSLYFMLIEGEASPEICCAANSTDQARILFNYIEKFASQIDPKQGALKHYRNYIQGKYNNGICKVISSDASKMDGMNLSLGIIDEYHESPTSEMYEVLKTSMGFREAPLLVIITTAGFNLESPCHDMYMLSLEILAGVKEQDNFWPFIWSLDPDDDWTDEKNFIKCQPNLGVTVTKEFMTSEIQRARNDATAEVGVKTKVLNMWCQAATVWLPSEKVAATMKSLRLEDFEGCMGILGLDLGSTSDITALSLLIPKDGVNYFFNWSFVPSETLKTHAQRDLYLKFVKEGTLFETPGNCTDYQYIINKIVEISKIIQIREIAADSWNATQTCIDLGDLGFNVVPFSQAIGNYNSPTKSMERNILDNLCVINKSACVLWQFSNVVLKMDHNGNIKPDKSQYKKKIDNVIAMINALGSYERQPFLTDTQIFVF